MDIEKGKFTWRGELIPLNLSAVDSIGLHHMHHPTADEYQVEEWHKANGWLGFGYNYWIGFDGRVVEGRGMNIGAAVEGENSHIISIGFQGAYHPSDSFESNKKMPDEQFNSGVRLISWLKEELPQKNISIFGHRHWNNTDCPGDYFPIEELKSGIMRNTDPNEWKYEGLKSLRDAGLINNYDDWVKKIDEPMPVWATTIILDRIYQKLKS